MLLNSPNMHLHHQPAHSTDVYQALSGPVLLITQGPHCRDFGTRFIKRSYSAFRLPAGFSKVNRTKTFYLEMKQHNSYNSWHGDSTLALLKQAYGIHTHTWVTLHMLLIYPFPNTWSYYYIPSKIWRNFKDVPSNPPFMIFI